MKSIAIVGHGTIGSGVRERIDTAADRIAQKSGHTLRVKAILDLAPSNDPRFVKDFSAIEQDPEIAVVAEMIGGTGAAYTFTKAALQAGKHVVTSNKELVATHGTELLQLAAANNVRYLFEASVGGGIPALSAISRAMPGDEIQAVCGILNGTTNYILARMEAAGLSQKEALAEAQAKGYAEADASADLEGKDASRKITILAALAFGALLNPDSVPTTGITAITADVIAAAKAEGYAVRLLAFAERTVGAPVLAVLPALVASCHPFANVRGVLNAVLTESPTLGTTIFIGEGAGKDATASAVVADIVAALDPPPAAALTFALSAEPPAAFVPKAVKTIAGTVFPVVR